MPGAPASTYRRVVTTHKGHKSAILVDEERELTKGFASKASTIWRSHQHPAELYFNDPVDSNPEIYTKGSLIRMVEFAPHTEGHNHRTASLDYAIIVSGELELVMDDGSKTIVRAGDIVVQQATMHQWNNLTDTPTRVIFVLVPSQKPVVNGIEVAESGVPEEFLPTR